MVSVVADVEAIIRSAEQTRLFFNASKCEISADNVDNSNKNIDTFKVFIRISPHDMMLRGAPDLKGLSVDIALHNKVG